MRDEYLILVVILGMIAFGQYLKRQIKSELKDGEIELINKEIECSDDEDSIQNIEKNIEPDKNDLDLDKNRVVSKNQTMIQMFEWYSPNDGTMYKKIKEDIKDLSENGITTIWMPPACKSVGGIYDVGYGIYDLYDLGEFDQKGSIRTKYGTKEEYIQVIEEVHKYNMEVYADVVFNHKAGADDSEIVKAIQVEKYDRNIEIGEVKEIESHTIFTFLSRNNKYSDYKWNHKDFTGVDYDNLTKENGIYKFFNKEWATDVDTENGNYDYLMFADVDINNINVQNELIKWGKWFIDETNIDGFRLDAVKHIQFDFFKIWLDEMRKYKKKDMFAV